MMGMEKVRRHKAMDAGQTVYSPEWQFLVEMKAPWSGMLCDLLKQNRIPVVTENRMGAGMALKVGTGAEHTRFYVPPDRFPCASALVGEIFSQV